jgi:hypothetical protein
MGSCWTTKHYENIYQPNSQVQAALANLKNMARHDAIHYELIQSITEENFSRTQQLSIKIKV